MAEESNFLTLFPCVLSKDKFGIKVKWTIKNLKETRFAEFKKSKVTEPSCIRKLLKKEKLTKEDMSLMWNHFLDHNYFYSPEVYQNVPLKKDPMKIQLRLIRRKRISERYLNTEKYGIQYWDDDIKYWGSLPSYTLTINPKEDVEYTKSIWNRNYYTLEKKNLLHEDLREYLSSIIQSETFLFNNESYSIKDCDKQILLDYVDKEFSDEFVIECNGKEFKTKKIFLQARSPVLNSMLQTNFYKEAQEGRMSIPDFDPKIVEKMIEFFETDFINEAREYGNELYKIARKYQTESFMNYTHQLLVQTLSKDNASDRVKLVEEYVDEKSGDIISDWIDYNLDDDPFSVRFMEKIFKRKLNVEIPEPFEPNSP